MKVADSRLTRIGKLRIALELLENFFAENPGSVVPVDIAMHVTRALAADDQYAIQERVEAAGAREVRRRQINRPTGAKIT